MFTKQNFKYPSVFTPENWKAKLRSKELKEVMRSGFKYSVSHDEQKLDNLNSVK